MTSFFFIWVVFFLRGENESVRSEYTPGTYLEKRFARAFRGLLGRAIRIQLSNTIYGGNNGPAPTLL